MDKNSLQQIPLKKDLWTLATPDGRPRLTGSRCGNCGEVFFPKKSNGWCVHCQRRTLEEVLLSPRGRIAAITVVQQQPAGGFYHGPVPYAYGLVDMPEGIRVTSLITADNLGAIKVGSEAELIIRPLYEDQEGHEVITFMFTPIA